MPEPWQHFFTSHGLRLSYWAWGDEGKPPLVLVHGTRDHARTWDRVAEALRDDYRVLALDLRGHGDSEHVRGGYYGLLDYAADVLALVEVAGGRAMVVGHSLGGGIVMLAAGAFPERFERLVSVEGVNARVDEPSAEQVSPEWVHDWAARARGLEGREPRVYPTFASVVERVHEANRRLSPEMAEHLARWAARSVDGGYVWKYDPWLYARTPTEVRRPELPAFWARITCPVLHVVGEVSPMGRDRFEGRPAEAYFPDARLVRVPDAGHYVHHDNLEGFDAALLAFLGASPAIPRD